MKKIKFLNGIGAMFAFAAVTLAGSLASCEQEEFDATFDAGAAEVTFNVKVKALVATDANTVAFQEVTTDVELSGAVTHTASNANPIEISFADGYKGGDVTATASYNGKTGTATISTNALKKGGVATYDILVVIGDKVVLDDKTVVVAKTNTTSEPWKSYLKPANGNYSHNGNDYWIENANNYILLASVDYKLYNYQTATATVEKAVASELIEEFAKAMTYGNPEGEDATLDLKVSAWSLYCVWVEGESTSATYEFSYEETGESLGQVVVEGKNGTAAQYQEMAHPSHSNYYHYGHGHGSHGDSNNAGGGIIEMQ